MVDQIATESGIGDGTSTGSGGPRAAPCSITPYQVAHRCLADRGGRRQARGAAQDRPGHLQPPRPRASRSASTHSAQLRRRPARTTATVDLATDSPYNTRARSPACRRRRSRCPDGPRFEAAVAPGGGEWLYYVLADEAGRHTFTNTYDEFLEAKAECSGGRALLTVTGADRGSPRSSATRVAHSLSPASTTPRSWRRASTGCSSPCPSARRCSAARHRRTRALDLVGLLGDDAAQGRR